MLNDDDGIARITQTAERADQFGIVTLVQTDARLVQDIHNADERGADLRCEADSLCLTARKRSRFSPKRQVIKSHAFQKAESRADLLQDLFRDLLFRTVELQLVEKLQRAVHVQGAYLINIESAHRNGKDLGRESLALAGGTRDKVHKLIIVFPARLGHTHFDHIQNAVPCGIGFPGFSAEITDGFIFFRTRSAKQDLQRLLGIIFDRRIEVEAVFFSDRLDQGAVPGFLAHGFEAVDGDRASAQRERTVGDHLEFRNDLHFAHARAFFARAERAVERKHTGRKLRHANAVLLAGIILRKAHFLTRIRKQNDRNAPTEGECRFQRVGETAADIAFHHKAVNDHLNGMLFIFIKRGNFIQRIKVTVDAHADVAALSCLVEHLFVHTLLARNHRRKEHKLRALGQLKYLIEDGIRRHLADLFSANGTVRNTDARVEQSQVIVDLRYRSDRGTGIFRGRFLINGDRGRETVDEVHVGLIELSQKLSRVRRKGFHETPMAFRVKCIERKRGFTRARKSRENNQFVARNIDVDVFQVMHPCAFNTDIFCRHIFLFPFKRPFFYIFIYFLLFL